MDVTDTFETKKVKIEKNVKIAKIEHMVRPAGLAYHEQ